MTRFSTTPADIQEMPSYELAPRFTLADRCRLAVTAAALERTLTWTEAERIQSAVDYCYDGKQTATVVPWPPSL